METITSFFNWHILLLISPLIVGIVLFGVLSWSDRRHDRKKKRGNG